MIVGPGPGTGPRERGAVMERSLLDKLVGEVLRYRSKDFLKASMAVCALAASADDEVSLSEHYQIDHALATEPALQNLDRRKATDTLYDYIHALRSDGEHSKRVLYNKVGRMAGDHKRARTLMRVAYLIIAADGEVRDAEREEFARLCRLLDLEPKQVWAELAS